VTHGFFIIMGGFRVSTPSKGYPLNRQAALNHLRSEPEYLPLEEEIEDRSKSDLLAKTLVLFQTLWFVTQCIARWVQHLQVTELEVVTLAYALFNLGIYLAWLKKPRGVGRPIRIPPLPTGSDQPETSATRRSKTLSEYITPAIAVIAGGQDNLSDWSTLKKVPTFYSGDPLDEQIFKADITTLVFGILFGAIHCIAWDFPFPSQTEHFLWRLSSITIVGVPVLAFVLALPFMFKRFRIKGLRGSSIPLVIVLVLAGILYVAARITTVVLALVTLKSLPLGAYQTVSWLNFIPHI
jgi:hypothetical protein